MTTPSVRPVVMKATGIFYDEGEDEFIIYFQISQIVNVNGLLNKTDPKELQKATHNAGYYGETRTAKTREEAVKIFGELAAQVAEMWAEGAIDHIS